MLHDASVSRVVFLDKEKRLLPSPNRSCQEHDDDAISLRAYGSFHLSLEDNERHA
jgi:hypothetical protein